MLRKIWQTSSLLFVLLCLGACTQDAQTQTPCGPGDQVEADGVTVCVYREEIIETGFDCPQATPHRMRYGDFVVCSEDSELPRGFPEHMEEDYDSGLPQDGCVRANQCPGTQICQAGECERSTTTDAGHDADTSDADGQSNVDGVSQDATTSDANDVEEGDADARDASDADDVHDTNDTSDTSSPDSDVATDGSNDSEAGPPDSTSGCADRFESNETRPTAAPLGSGLETDLTLCSASDEDYYALQLNAGDQLRVVVEYDIRNRTGTANLVLMDASGVALDTGKLISNTGSPNLETIAIPDQSPATFTVPSAGTYYVLVDLFSGTEILYDLEIVVQ